MSEIHFVDAHELSDWMGRESDKYPGTLDFNISHDTDCPSLKNTEEMLDAACDRLEGGEYKGVDQYQAAYSKACEEAGLEPCDCRVLKVEVTSL